METSPYALTTGPEAQDQIERVLRETQIGVLSLSNQNCPYGVPMNHMYLPGHLFFHGALSGGKKIGIISRNAGACYTVMRPLGELKPDTLSCHLEYESVICTGRIYNIESLEERAELVTRWRACYAKKPGRAAHDAARATGFLKFIIDEATLRSGSFHPDGLRPLCVYNYGVK
jgi:nitroimidazol reductase NimA-like FMN-containing flavoprotein (pyridoxamine 5'-phosphate oxidase superfamily)